MELVYILQLVTITFNLIIMGNLAKTETERTHFQIYALIMTIAELVLLFRMK
jgi:hypothetical protein